jgi:hypothetical protein
LPVFFAVSTNVCYHKNSDFPKTAFDSTNFLKLPSIFTINVAQNSERKLRKKIRSLPPYKITVLEDFIDFLLTRSEAHLLVDSATKHSEAAFAKIWDNPEDADYDNL